MLDFPVHPEFDDYERLLAARVVFVKAILMPGIPAKSINDLADYAFAFARHLEEATGRTSKGLIEQVFRSCSACAANSGQKNWLSPKNLTCQNIIREICGEHVDPNASDDYHAHDIEALLADIDTVGYAIAFGMYLYASEKVSEDPKLATRSENIPLLQVMTFSDPINPFKTFLANSWQDLLRMLLEHGADSNYKYRNISPWR